jgi:hypothetical protein
MNRPFAFAIAAMLGLTGCASTSSRSPDASVSSVAGTTWVSKETDGTYEYTFVADGVLLYKSAAGYWNNGSWKQDGNSIYMETNKKYAERRGVMTGRQIRGHAWNVTGKRWTWVATKKK